jgi:Arc/MetJ-type ribon-helix-helix transcriptional regulator
MPKSRRKEVAIMKTVIYLESEAHNQLRHIAVDERVSMSELVRRAVEEFLKKYKRKGGEKK